jgi:hypothetical protein
MRLKSWVLSSSAGCLWGFFEPGGSQIRVQQPVEVPARPRRSDGPQLSLPLRPRPSQKGRQFCLFVVMQQAEDVVIDKAITALEEVEFDGKGEAGDLSA